MKGLYKKIGAIVLAGMMVFGGGALAGVQKVDAVSWLAIQVPGAIDVQEFARRYEFDILVYGSEGRVNEYIKKQVKKEFLKKRLKQVREAKNKKELEKDIQQMKKSKLKMHILRYKCSDYIILFK